MQATRFHSVRSLTIAIGAIACLVVGCGKSVEIAPIEGKVTYKGQPLKFGTVMFQPMSGGQPAQGLIQPDGSFKLSTHNAGEGARLGTNQVSVRCYENQDPAKQGGQFGGGQSLGRLLIPVKYTMASSSGLTVDVKAEGNEPVVLELTD
jgi:hypothetical protein